MENEERHLVAVGTAALGAPGTERMLAHAALNLGSSSKGIGDHSGGGGGSGADGGDSSNEEDNVLHGSKKNGNYFD